MICTLNIALWSIVRLKILVCAALDKGGSGLDDKWEDAFLWAGEFELLRMCITDEIHLRHLTGLKIIF